MWYYSKRVPFEKYVLDLNGKILLMWTLLINPLFESDDVGG